MKEIIQGVQNFRENVFGSASELFKELASGQNPKAMFITCSDSRVVPTLFTQTKPGDLFEYRNAGNLIPPYGESNGGEAGAIELAVDELSVETIIVCGHSDCGAMKLLLNPEAQRELPEMGKWLRYAQPTLKALEKYDDSMTGDDLVMAAVEENVLVQLKNLQTYPFVAKAIEAGKLNLQGWVYHIHTGNVFSYNPDTRAFEPIHAN